MNRLAHTLLAATACLGGAGCFSARPSAPSSFPLLAARNATQTPLRLLDNKAFLKVVAGHADDAWAKACGNAPRSSSYAAGFREGFIDYVDAGGAGEPPYLPPFRYRKTRFQNDAGVEVIEDWYAGFRHGAAVARTSGLRERVLVPLPGPAVPADPVLSPPRPADAPTHHPGRPHAPAGGSAEAPDPRPAAAASKFRQPAEAVGK